MDFSFTEEQGLMRESVKKFVSKYSFEARRKLTHTALGFSRDHYKTFAELGWTALPFSEEDGGMGGSAVDTMIILEELGKGLVVEPYLPCIVFAGAVLKQASAEQKAVHLQNLINAEKLYAVAYVETNARYDALHTETRAQKTGSGFSLTGEKVVVFGGGAADYLIVSARTSGAVGDAQGVTLFLVDKSKKGVQIEDRLTVDGLHAARVGLEGVQVAASDVIGQLDAGGPLLQAAIDAATIALGAEAMGIMEVLYKNTVQYTKERVQFERPLSTFQVLQFRMADMYVAYEEAKSMVYMATMSLDTGKDVAKAASAMKVLLDKSGTTIGESAIQLHGGMGMTEEMPISHYFKRMSMIAMLFGDASHHLKRYQQLSA